MSAWLVVEKTSEDSKGVTGRDQAGAAPSKEAPRGASSREKLAREIEKKWQRWSAAHALRSADETFAQLKGASDEEILTAEKKLGKTFPADFFVFLKLVNGDPDEISFYDGSSLLYLDSIVKGTLINQEIAEDFAPQHGDLPSKGDWWHPNFVQVTDNSGGGLCIDVNTGHVWYWNHDGGIFGRVAMSWSDFLEMTAAQLEATEGKIDSIDLSFFDAPYLDEDGNEMPQR